MRKHRTFKYLVLVLVVMFCQTVLCASKNNASDGPLSETDAFPYNEQLDDNYRLEWKSNSTHIMFHIQVKTKGYVGFGISYNGDMSPGDMVVAWMSNQTTVHFHDRHAKSRAMPVKDKEQDWNLLDIQRENNTYQLKVLRKLNTCDEKEDISIESGTTRIIYAYSDAVPDSDDNIPYHGPTTRGTKSVLLLDPPPKDSDVSNMPDDVKTIDFVNRNFSVPSTDTTYSCTVMKIPQPLKEKHHMIKYEPVIQKGHEKLVHHMLLFYCDSPIPDSMMYKPFKCYEQEPEELTRYCRYTMLAWGIGGTGFNYPPNVGHSLGTPEDPVYFKLETHYDNRMLKSDLVDSSGIRLYLTKQLREHDAGTLQVGAVIDKFQIIPPNIHNFPTRGYCPPKCLEKSLGKGEIRIFADILHSHLLARKMATRHVRNGEELPPIVRDDHYDFDYQETRAIKPERIVKGGDMLIAECHYDSTNRSGVTYGGFSSKEEMCISFLLYYPKTSINTCFTRVVYKKDGKYSYPMDVFRHVNNTDWSVESNRVDFLKTVQESDVYDFCIYRNTSERVISTQPKTFTQFKPDDTCDGGSGSGNGGTSGRTSAMTNNILLCFVLYYILHSVDWNYAL